MRIENLSGVEIGNLVNTKQVSALEVVEACEDQYEKCNGSINAFTYTKFDEARRDAAQLQKRIMNGEDCGLLAGAPIALKDFLPSKTGWKASHGGVPSRITVDKCDSEFYKAASGQGAIAVGKTNAPAYGFRGVTDNVMYGPTSTPFDTERNSGGSSGGSAAAVASGIVPIAEGGDAGGSIRVPSAWCGCYGFKPSAGLVPSVIRPDAWAATHPYCCGGPITRTVEDAAAMLTRMMSYNPRDPLSVPLSRVSFLDAMHRDVKPLKVAFTYNFNLFPMPEEDVKSGLEIIADTLEDIGMIVDEVTFDFKGVSKQEFEWAWLLGMSIDSAVEFNQLSNKEGFDFEQFSKEVPDEFMMWCERAAGISIHDYSLFHKIRTAALDAHQDVFDNYDIIIAPVTGCMPVLNSNKHTDGLVSGPKSINGVEVDPLIGFGYTYLENMVGTPAASVPAGLINGLPCGVQIIGKRYHDADVLAVSHAIEQARPWIQMYSLL